ncbi:S41 family peptidase [Persicitalea sp.]|uniref:S41 family peptidase n=1 Tax=Persicitalea sp. TaxID=3100273 RepID=UPI0035931FA4
MPPSLTNQQMRQDVAFLNKKLEKLYPGLGYYGSQKAYEDYRDSLVARLPNSLAYRDFFKRIAPLVNSQKDGHLNLYQRKRITDKNTTYLPFTLREVAGKYYVYFNGSADSTLGRGTELLTIEGQELSQLHALLADNFRAGADADIATGRLFRTLNSFPAYYNAWFGENDSLLVSYVSVDSAAVATGDTLQKYVVSQTKKAVNEYLKKRYPKDISIRKNLSLARIDSSLDGVVLRVSSFSKFPKGDFFNAKFKRKLRQDFRLIKEKNYQNLVIDMRSNGGGSVANSGYLLSYLLPEPFSVFSEETLKPGAVLPYITTPLNPVSPVAFFLTHHRDRTTGLWRTNTARKKDFKPNKKYGYRNNLYLLVNGASFSATVSVLSHLRDQGVGKIVGEAPGGAYWGDFAARFKVITLPNSGLRIRIPLKTMYHDVKPLDDPEIKPDLPLVRTYEDIITPGRDYGLEYVKSLIRQDK